MYVPKLHRLYPSALEQEIHRDGKYIDKNERSFNYNDTIADTIKKLSQYFIQWKRWLSFQIMYVYLKIVK